jgi:hypothetical protein
MVYFYDASALRPFGRSLCLLPLLLLVPSCLSQALKYACFKPTDGYMYPGLGKMRVNRSVLKNINDWCVGRVTAMEYLFYSLSVHDNICSWNVQSDITVR